MIRISQTSPFTYVMSEITPIDELGAPQDPTDRQVQMAFSPTEELNPKTPFFPAQWQVNTTPRTSRYYAICGIGANSVCGILPVGVWWPFTRILDNPEQPDIPGEPFRVFGVGGPVAQASYPAGTSLPDLWVSWEDASGALVPFGTDAYAFQLSLWARSHPDVVLFTKTNGFLAANTDPNLVVIWDQLTEVATLPVGLYDGQIVGTRLADGRTRKIEIALAIT